MVADAAETVLPPPIGAGAGVLVGKEVPRRAALAVILSDRPPLASRQIRTPPAPELDPVPIFFEALLFGVVDHESEQSTKDLPTLPG